MFRGAGISETLRQLRQMDHVTVDEEREEHMHLVVSRGDVVAFVVEESAAGNADEVTCNDQSKFGQVALIPRIGLCLKYSVEHSANKADTVTVGMDSHPMHT